MSRTFRVFVALLAAALPLRPSATVEAQSADPARFSSLDYRMVGPYRGGRSTAVTGVIGRPTTWYMGTTGGGIWKSDDDGASWTNISDGYFGGSIGAVDVADSDPNVVYVGMGSVDIRGNTSAGRGMWRSTDAGRTWTSLGLEDAGQIGRIEVHPDDPDLVYAAVLGHAFGKNDTRGVYRSRDGGATWENVLFLNDSTGASDLTLNPKNPRELYAGMWRGERKPWALISGGEEGGVYKTTDGGDTWTKLSGGLPEGLVGKVGVSVSPANPDRVWAIIEAEPGGGVYRSDDAGETWTRTNSENNLRQRAWYYTHVQADPQDENTVYALNTGLYRSVDGGRTFEGIQVPHGDIHDLWIYPTEPERMIVADDGGGQVTVNGGRTWSTYFNQPTAELYDVIVDNAFPYRLYGAQQDNTTISVLAWMDSNTLYPKEHWENIGGCETGPVALHPDHPRIVFAGCYGGVIDRMDRETRQVRNVNIYPQLQLGNAASEMKHRFQWVSPMAVSPHDTNTVFHGSQFVNRSTDGGLTWETISPDLTTNDPETQDYPGGPINVDGTGVEIYNVVFSIAVSPHDQDVIWAGSDDGLVHVTRDGGENWANVTPPGLPARATVDEIDLSVHQPGRAIVAVQAYRLDDFQPYVFRTNDFGETWSLLTDGENGIPDDHPVRTVREDPVRPGLLYAGTEFGIFASFDDGGSWQSIQLDLPVTPVTGMRVAHDDLVLSTQGRSFWILDDLAPLRQSADEIEGAAHLYAPSPAYRANMGGGGGLSELNPEPIPQGAVIDYYLAEDAVSALTIEVVDDDGRVARTFSSDSAAAADHGTSRLEADGGHHRITWDLMYRGPTFVDGAVIWGYQGGIKAPPGTYEVRLSLGTETDRRALELRPDPRLDVPQADYIAQFEMAVAVKDSLNAVLNAVRSTRGVRDQVGTASERAEGLPGGEQVTALADTITDKLTEVEQDLMQTRNQSGQDPIRFPPRLDNQYVELYNYVTGVDGYIAGGAEGRPTPGAYDRFDDLNAQWTELRSRLQTVLDTDIVRFNQLMEDLGIPAVVVDGRARVIS